MCLTWQIFYKQSQRDCLREHKTVEHKPEFSMPRDDRVMTRDASREYIPVGEPILRLLFMFPRILKVAGALTHIMDPDS